MVIYHAKGLTARSQARDLLALAAAVCGHSEPPEKIFKKSLDIPTV